MTPPIHGPVRLLLVDDDSRFADYLRVLLRKTRTMFELSGVATVDETLRVLADGQHDVCLLDYRLGDEDGLEVLRRGNVREFHAPIVLLTGDQDESLELMAIEQGAEDYLNKSELEPRRLERTLLRAIARHRAAQAVRKRETQLQEQLRQAHKMEAVGQLAGGVAHDFNNLLTAILGYTEFLRSACAGMPEAERDLEEVHSAATSASALTAQLLAFSRKQVLKPEVLRVNVTIEGMRHLLSRIVGEDITLVTRFGDEVPRIEADLVQLQQVMINLVANARDAMPRGGRLLIETSTRVVTGGRGGASLPPGRYASIVVADNGCGMDPETQARIFEPFFTTKGVGRGTGLGLATVYGIIKQSGGDIVCDTAPAAGTTFTIVLPASEKPCPSDVVRAASGEQCVGTILLVEDRADVRVLTRRILERRGFHVFDTDDPEHAVRVADDTPIDLLLTDVVMPEASGPDLARRIRVKHPHLPVIFMSGFTGHSAIADTDGAPFLQKPFTPDGLVQTVRAVLEAIPEVPS